MKIAYLDCFSGVSGDMFVGALLDAGLPAENLDETIAGLGLDGFTISHKQEERNHIFGTKFSVTLHQEDQPTRHLSDIKDILRSSNLTPQIIEKCISVFERLAETEGEIHHLSPENVHFHEVGAVDSIIDVVASVAGMYHLGIEKLFVSKIPVGSGMIDSAHGTIPLPAPATIALLKGVPIYDSGQDAEMVTPTGAALLTSLGTSFGPMPPMTIERVGYGVGTRSLSDRPNLLRILVGRDAERGRLDTVVLLESNLDDMSPELLGYLMDSLFEAGALDVSFSHIHMKKNRPGIRLQVIARPEDRDRLVGIVFRESTSLGIRISYSQREVLERNKVTVDSPWGEMRLTRVADRDHGTVLVPEYEECRRIAKQHNLPLRDVYAWAGSLSRGPEK
ncbi:MAG: nickel pincer cofactor biosynthesis protein LarC [Deltaproteobacteria bacterium]|nr:nickel pincer cofactor biosynthesis protein LarC [Deltaproteobacteria bacterium]RLB29501.1 MAG: nickel pincer cofactor biosynthesis protein LarC [Deltaproteobacteria bacterium]